ncbi:MAG: hypothetical protein IMZ46_05435 [Acidobacteria bacterium]|nr:hypothetical protein [Acidobacteriota bacterium]
MGETTSARNGPNLDTPEATADLDEPPAALRPPTAAPHSLSAASLAASLGTDQGNGLSHADAAARLERDGPNRVEAARGTSAWQIFLRQISNSLTLVLVIVMVLSFSIQDYIEASVVAAVILFNIVVGYACVLGRPLIPKGRPCRKPPTILSWPCLVLRFEL